MIPTERRQGLCGDGVGARSPVPGQELVEPGGGMIEETSEEIGELGFRIDVVELGGLDQLAHEGGALTAAVGATE